MSFPACRICHGEKLSSLGALPDVEEFAGRAVDIPLPGGTLWRCRNCHFVFRHPILGDDDYARLYRRSSAEVWVSQEKRPDFELISRYLARLNASKRADILDVGCYTGQLLTSLPESYTKYGVEPSEAAARIASERGVVVVADTVRSLRTCTQQFDIITACDVIEHVVDPVEFLTILRDRIRGDGRIVLSTGNAGSWLWRLTGSRYWYCYYPEHISFLGSRALPVMAARCGLKVTDAISFNYARRKFLSRVSALLGALLYAASPLSCRALRKGARGGLAKFVPPGCGATRDHMLCVLTRDGGSR